MQTLAVRPLSVGELFDRTIAVSVHAIVPLAIILVPYSALMASSLNFWPVLGGGGIMLVFPASIAALISAPIAAGATIYILAAHYRGASTTVPEALRCGARNWGRVVMTYLRFFCVQAALFAVVGIVFAVMLVAAAIAFAGSFAGATASSAALSKAIAHLPGPTLALVVLLSLAVIVGYICMVVIVLTAQGLALTACIVDGMTSGAAFGTAMRFFFGGGERMRGLIVCAAFGAVYMVIALVYGGGIGISAIVMHPLGAVGSAAGSTVVQSVGRTIIWIFMQAFALVYYYDLRARQDGLDLARALDALPVPTA